MHECGFFVLRHPSAALVDLTEQTNQRFRAASKWRPVQVLASDRPIQNCSERLKTPVNGSRTQNSVFLPIDAPGLPQVSNEVLHAGGLDRMDLLFTKESSEWFQLILDYRQLFADGAASRIAPRTDRRVG